MIQSAVPLMHPNKRKTNSIEDLFEAKKAFTMFSLKQEFNGLLSRKKQHLQKQRRASLLVETLEVNDNHSMHEFSRFYRKLSNAPMSQDEHPSQIALIEQVIQESVVVEWPRSVGGLTSSDDVIEVDMAPLIHRARNVIKCRTSHPTMRIKVYAISREDDSQLRSHPVVEAFFKATLVKLTSEGGESRLVAGRMILTQREGTAAAKSPEQNAATVTSDGRLIASQASCENSTLLLGPTNESGVRTTNFKYENGVLCATFPEMGVTLNSMVDRRQLATRYAIQIDVSLNIDNKLLVNHTMFSHPFLIAITNDQTEPLLHSIFWNRLADTDCNDCLDTPVEATLKWSLLRTALAHFIKTQVTQARSLDHHEICHLQCMILLPRVIACGSSAELAALEMSLYGNIMTSSLRGAELRDRLLSEEIRGETLIERRQFMLDKCVAILDMTTELPHSMWLWLFKVSEMIQDVGHRLCPSPAVADKKSSKTKKQMAASEEYQTMISLFNKGFLTLSSLHTVRQAFRDSDEENCLLLRFCDENCGYLSIAYGYDENSSDLPIMGSISAEQVKQDFKQGIPEVLMDEKFPARFERIIKIDGHRESIHVQAPRKSSVFHNYRTSRLMNDSIIVADSETVRVNPLTGKRIERATPPPPSPSTILQGLINIPQLGQGSPLALNLLPGNLLALFQQQLAQLQIPSPRPPEGFDMGTFHRRTNDDQDDRSDDTSVEDVAPPTSSSTVVDSLLQKVLDQAR